MMTSYAYQVRDRSGKKVSGVMKAPSEKTVADILLEKGYLITTIKSTHGLPLSLSLNMIWMPSKVSPEDLTMFYFQLSNMIDAGIPLLAALQTLVSQIENRKLKEVTQKLITKVEEGGSFSEAMSEHEKTFPLLYRSMIRVGETSGKLAETLRHVGELNEAKSNLEHQVKSALAYPMVLIFASIAVVIFMMVWIIPTFTEIFNKADIPLPLPTRMVHSLSLWIRSNPLLLIGLSSSVVIGFRFLVKIASVQYYLDRFWLSVPALGLLIRRIEVARWSRSAGLMISSGVPILQTLEISKDLTQNALFREVLMETCTAVQGGGKLADNLQKNGIFPSDVVQMVATGENSGTLDKMLYKVAGFYDQLISRTLKKVTGMIEPIFIMIMGGIVAFIMLSVLLPIFDMIKFVNK